MNMSSSDRTLKQIDSNEEFDNYMDSVQLDFFREKLESWLKELDIEHRNISIPHIDSDQGTLAGKTFSDDSELTANDRYLVLKKNIQNALRRIKDGTYGYCEATGEKIGIERLRANPITLYCIEEQERRDKK